MTLSQQISKHFHETFTGGNWSEVDLAYALEGVDRQMALHKEANHNSIAMLLAHIHFYVTRVLKVLNGGELQRGELDSFQHPPLQKEKDWEEFKSLVFKDAGEFAIKIADLPDSKWGEVFVEEKYGSYFRNILGIIEHSYYHIGQIVTIKKLNV